MFAIITNIIIFINFLQIIRNLKLSCTGKVVIVQLSFTDCLKVVLLSFLVICYCVNGTAVFGCLIMITVIVDCLVMVIGIAVFHCL